MVIKDKLIQETIAELQLLALKKPLEGYNLSKAKQLMGILREAGYTNQQVSELIDGAWTEPTIKLYTRGVEVKDSSIKQNELNLIAEMVRKGLGFDEVQFALSLKADLDSKGLSFGAVSSLLEGAARAGLSLNPLITLFQDIGEILPQPSINDLTNIITYRDELKTLGIGTSEMRNLAVISRKYGGIAGMLQAISTFKDLKSIQDEISKASAAKQELDTKIGLVHSEIETLQKEKLAFQRPLRLYEDLKIVGFDVTTLGILAYTCKKYNNNTKHVLEAVNTYANLEEIQLKTKQFESIRQDEETRLKEIREQRAHLQTVLDMSNRLLYEFNYTIPAIQELHDMAKKYHDPIEVFKTLGRYGELKNIEEEIENLSKKKTELLSKIKEMHIQLQSLQGQSEAVKESLSGLLQPVSTEIAKVFGSAIQKLTTAYTEQFGIIKKESEEYAQRLGQGIALQEELNLARIINSLEKYPTQAKNLDPDYVILLLDAVEKYCLASGIDPKITLKETVVNAGPIFSDTEVYVHELIDRARKGLLRGIRSTGWQVGRVK